MGSAYVLVPTDADGAMSLYRARVASPPSMVTGSLRRYLETMAQAINDLPVFSFYSGTTPAAAGILGLPGHLAINLGSASTDSRVWLHGGAGNSYNSSGWVVLRTLA